MRTLCCMLLLLASVGAVAAQPAQAPAWDVTLKANTVASSNLETVNRCKKNHQFQIQLTNLPFLHFSSTQVNVKGGATQLVPVKFDTTNLAPGVYQGTLLVVCQSCKGEATCMQDREVLQVVLRVTSDSPASGPPGAPTTNQPDNTPTTNQPPSNQPATAQPSPAVVGDQTPGKQVGISGGPIGVSTQISPANDRCAALKDDTEKLRQLAEEKEAGATAAQERAKTAKELADEAEQKARELEAAAKRAADLARPPASGYGARVNGQVYEAGDIAQLEVMRKKNNDDLEAGRITREEHQRRANELTAAKAREERLANEAKLKKEAEEAKAAAEKARADADKARDAADAAQKAADEAKKEAAEARKKFDESARKLAEACRKLEEAKAKAEANAAAAAAAAEKKRQEDEVNRLTEENNAKGRQEHLAYLIANIDELELIKYSLDYKEIPGATEFFFDFVQKLTGRTVRDFLQSVAGNIGKIPEDYVKLIGESYKNLGVLLNPCTEGGRRATEKRLRGMKKKNGELYSESEARDKTWQMCEVLRDFKSKIQELNDLVEKQKKGK